VNAPDHWEKLWRGDSVHAWLGINGLTPAALDDRCSRIFPLLEEQGGARVLEWQDAAAQVVNGQPTTSEHFGYTDG
jgi:hypothetical protein